MGWFHALLCDNANVVDCFSVFVLCTDTPASAQLGSNLRAPLLK